MMRGKTSTAIALAAVAAVAISACGSSGGSSSSSSASSSSASSDDNGVASKSPDQILTTAAQAAQAAHSVHVAGTVQDGGQTIGINLSIASGKGATGTISEGIASFKLVEAGGAFYIQPNARFLTKFTHSSAAAAVAARQVAEGEPQRQLVPELRRADLDQEPDGLAHQEPRDALQGLDIDSRRPEGDRDALQQGRHDVRRDDRHAVSAAGLQDERLETGKVTFSQYNQAFSISAPSNSVNLDQLQSGG